jgi:glycosyltransferase involved in cell wall biosynthesis
MIISIAITYNGEPIPRRGASIYRQQREPFFEYVICDDLFTDGTEALIERFRRSASFLVRFYKNAPNLAEKLALNGAALRANPGHAGIFTNAALMENG